jgi:TatD DNase family protein
MWIDTHCHLDAPEYAGAALAVAEAASAAGVSAIVIPAVHPKNFAAVAKLAEKRRDCFYALGIHPMYVKEAKDSDLVLLRNEVRRLMSLPASETRFVAIGEIGLDFFIPELTTAPMKKKQEHFYMEQLRIARDFDLPVLLHVRKSVDMILKYLRKMKVVGGIAHAFNGSFQQAEMFTELNFKLGFGGAMTFDRALQLRRLATNLPLESIVLETDSPDMSPVWLHPDINSPKQLPAIAAELAQLRGCSLLQVLQHTTANVQAVLPRLQTL